MLGMLGARLELLCGELHFCHHLYCSLLPLLLLFLLLFSQLLFAPFLFAPCTDHQILTLYLYAFMRQDHNALFFTKRKAAVLASH